MRDALPFEGLRVLDVSSGIAGAYATKLLVDAGADAVIVEPPGGDRAPPPHVGDRAAVPGRGRRPVPLPAGVDPLDPRRRTPGAGAGARRRRARRDLPPRRGALGTASRPPRGWSTTRGWSSCRSARGARTGRGPTARRRSSPCRPRAGRPHAVAFPIVRRCRRGRAARVADRARSPVWARLTGWLHARRTGSGQHVDVSMLEVATLCLNGPYHAIAGQWYPGFARRARGRGPVHRAGVRRRRRVLHADRAAVGGLLRRDRSPRSGRGPVAAPGRRALDPARRDQRGDRGGHAVPHRRGHDRARRGDPRAGHARGQRRHRHRTSISSSRRGVYQRGATGSPARCPRTDVHGAP